MFFKFSVLMSLRNMRNTSEVKQFGHDQQVVQQIVDKEDYH